MKWLCKLLRHTFVFRIENPKIAWNAGKDQAQLHMTATGEPRYWLECRRCGERIENPTREQLKSAGTDFRAA